MTKCTVIIPYYQRRPGILARALKSVFAQTHPDFDVIVVDDESPSRWQAQRAEPQLSADAVLADRKARFREVLDGMRRDYF